MAKGSLAESSFKVNDVIKKVIIDGKEYEITRTYNVIDIMLTVRKTSAVVFIIERDGAELEIAVDVSAIEYTDA